MKRAVNLALVPLAGVLACIFPPERFRPATSSGTAIIGVSYDDVDSLYFRGVDVDIAGKRLGSVYGGEYDSYQGAYVATIGDENQLEWRILDVGRTLLQRAGYPARSAASVSSKEQNPGGARFLLSGRLERVSVNRHEQRERTEIAMRIGWKLSDRYREDVIYSESISGEGESGPIVVEKIFGKLLSDPRFPGALIQHTEDDPISPDIMAGWSAANDTTKVVEGPQTIVISRADLNPNRAGSLLEKLADAVVTIETEAGSGTAFLITKEGLALTNHHVIKGNGEIVAFLRDGRRAVASLLRSDQRVDAALIRIDCRSLCTTAPLGDSGNVYVGDEVYAIGTPSLLSHTVTKGIVSAFRDSDGLTYIQTDAAVSPGSSGGPLVDAAGGKVVGIVTLKYTGLLDEGLGFAISIEDALRILKIEYFAEVEE